MSLPKEKSKFIVFVSAPYAALDGMEVEENVRHAIRIGESIRVHLGVAPFIPHLFHYWNQIHPHSEAHWLQLDLDILASCHGLLVASEFHSPGMISEKFYANEFYNLPVFNNFTELEDFINEHYS
jgi:hypothetical protein